MTADELNRLTIEVAKVLEAHGIGHQYNETMNSLRWRLADHLNEMTDVQNVRVPGGHTVWPDLWTSKYKGE